MPVIKGQVYPVTCRLPDGRNVEFAKLIVTLGAAYLFTGDPLAPDGVSATWSADLTGPPTLTQPWEGRGFWNTLPTTEGEVRVMNLGGCGCGNQVLKHYRPFPNGPARIT